MSTVWRIVVIEALGSTNDLVSRVATPGVAVFAESQENGRGRRGRSWVAPARTSILCSTFWRPDDLNHGRDLFWIAALCGARAIQDVTGLPAGVKWPNDLVISERKVGGVLVEGSFSDGFNGAVVGIGINVCQGSEELPPAPDYPVSSLFIESGRTVSREAVAAALLDHLAVVNATWGCDRNRSFAEWGRLVSTIGQRVRVIDAHRSWEGTAIGVDGTGQLVVADQAGLAVPVSDASSVRALGEVDR